MGAKQLGFGDYEQSTAKKQTKLEKFLSEMDKVVPWQLLIDLIEPFYPKTGSKGGRPPYPLATMLRIHLISISVTGEGFAFLDRPIRSLQSFTTASGRRLRKAILGRGAQPDQ